MLVIVIVPAFVLWGGSSFIRSRMQKPLGTIGGRKITPEEFNYYVAMAGLNNKLRALTSPEEGMKQPNTYDLGKEAMQYLLLLWKANKEKIAVSDDEVMVMIKKMFSRGGEFNKEFYLRLLERGFQMQPRVFEEYIRDFLKIDKLIDEKLQVQVTEDEIRDIYQKDTQKVKITYIAIPADKFKDQVTVTDEEIQEFYKQNQEVFKEAPRIKIKYTIVENNNPDKEKILKSLTKIKDLSQLHDEFSLDIKETDFITLNDPLEGIGWQPQINQIAFNLKKGQLSPIIELDKGLVIAQKIDGKESFIPKLNEIIEKVKQTLITKKSLEEAVALAQRILNQIVERNIQDLNGIAKKENLELKETDYFRYFDYIEGMGLDKEVSDTVFSLDKGQIHSQPILLNETTYIIKLQDKTPFDEESFQAKKAQYERALLLTKEMKGRVDLITDISKEADARISFPIQ